MRKAVAPHDLHGVKVTVALTCDAPSVAVTTTETENGTMALHRMLKLPELLLAGIVTCVAERLINGTVPGGDTGIVSCTVVPPTGAGPLNVIMPFAMPLPGDVETVEGVIARD